MERFIEFTNIRQENITYFKPEELDLKAGELVRIKDGIYDRYEATVLRLKASSKQKAKCAEILRSLDQMSWDSTLVS